MFEAFHSQRIFPWHWMTRAAFVCEHPYVRLQTTKIPGRSLFFYGKISEGWKSNFYFHAITGSFWRNFFFKNRIIVLTIKWNRYFFKNFKISGENYPVFERHPNSAKNLHSEKDIFFMVLEDVLAHTSKQDDSWLSGKNRMSKKVLILELWGKNGVKWLFDPHLYIVSQFSKETLHRFFW